MRAWGVGSVGLLVLGALVGCVPLPLPVTSATICPPGPMLECNVTVIKLHESAVASYTEIYDERTDAQGRAMGALSAGYQRWREECAPTQGDSTRACRELAESIGKNALTIDPTLAW